MRVLCISLQLSVIVVNHTWHITDHSITPHPITLSLHQHSIIPPHIADYRSHQQPPG